MAFQTCHQGYDVTPCPTPSQSPRPSKSPTPHPSTHTTVPVVTPSPHLPVTGTSGTLAVVGVLLVVCGVVAVVGAAIFTRMRSGA